MIILADTTIPDRRRLKPLVQLTYKNLGSYYLIFIGEVGLGREDQFIRGTIMSFYFAEVTKATIEFILFWTFVPGTIMSWIFCVKIFLPLLLIKNQMVCPYSVRNSLSGTVCILKYLSYRFLISVRQLLRMVSAIQSKKGSVGKSGIDLVTIT